MSTLIKNSLKNSMSYQAYRALVKQMCLENSTTGNDKIEVLANYTKLNEQRMKRWDKTIKVQKKAENRLKDFNNDMTWLVIAESWCGDAAHVLPVLNKIAQLNLHINLRIVLCDENPELMDAYLTNGNRAVPKLIIIDDETGDVLDTYGPRPTEATSLVNLYKAKYGALTPEFKEDLQHWYNNNKGQNIINDIVGILCKLEPSACQ
ncbi:thioredoxin family protein [Mariniflexile sp.]|uniref:thioredoxin family protein n=2 Tax=Mariniflexile sp. TaxID=1979402 RepID=UPI00404755A7